MRKFRFLFSMFMAMTMALSFNACSDDDDKPDVPVIPTEADYHFDLFLTIDDHGGMNKGSGTIIKSIDSLIADRGPIDLENDGVRFRTGDNTYSMEAIVKGKYYYQVPASNDRFIKLQVINNTVNIIQEQPFVTNTYKVRSYSHTWLNDNTLLIMAANGDATEIIWTKLNSDDMRIIEEGTLDLSLPEGAKVFTTSGILTYNEKAGKLYYFYYGKDKKTMGTATSKFWTAVINPTSMAIESNKENTLADEMAGSAYGELLQNCVMYDDNGNLYLAAYTNEDNMEQGHLLRINKGETDFDPSYEGFPNADGKLLTIQNLGNGKVLTYSRNDALGTSIPSFSHYYSIVNLNTGIRERLKYNGVEIPYNSGRFSQRSAVVDGKAYIGVNVSKTTNPFIYIYDIETGNMEKGLEIKQGYYFDLIRVIKNDDAE